MRNNNLREIEEIVGPDNALLLARVARPYGKQNWLYVPVRPERALHLAEVIGNDATRRLVARLGGCQLTVGRPDVFARRLDRAAPVRSHLIRTKTRTIEQLCLW